ncbi:MAG: 2-ketoisovalerate ferredoxin oxidoreductase [Candidatus Altiarchaeales archaeon IMC4]|nr:MAG: 2-ketoisovalerate ferredoxin oxidoreductase [Candidatus Altiarchaeales archaeon IMC4]
MGLPEEEYFAPGHRACAGCGAAIALRIITKAAGKNSILVEPTGCMEVVSTPYPETAWRLPWIHGAFENASSIASGVRAALDVLGKKDVDVVAFGGDGSSYDIGLGCLSGAFERGDDFTYICYDNEAYMNTGIQASGATPYGASTTTSPSGSMSLGKHSQKKNLLEILLAHGSPYLATASIGYPQDAYKRIRKAIETKGPTFVNLYAPCPTGWRTPGEKTVKLAKLAVETGFIPLYEVENGKYKVSMPLEGAVKPIEEYLSAQGRFAHLFKPRKNEEAINFIQNNINKSLERLYKLSKM